MKIIKYNQTLYSSKEWREACEIKKSKQKEEAFNRLIEKNGDEISLREYFSDVYRMSILHGENSYKFFGEPENAIEKIAFAEQGGGSDLGYILMKERLPEDLVEDRTSWDELKEYADDMYYFIESLITDFEEGKIIIKGET